jgi:hypothetical protein
MFISFELNNNYADLQMTPSRVRPLIKQMSIPILLESIIAMLIGSMYMLAIINDLLKNNKTTEIAVTEITVM